MKLLKSTFERRFVEHTMMIALPIMLQNGITNFVNMLDNIMVGRIGTDPMTGVSIVNSLLFVWNLCVFGGLSGIGIFSSPDLPPADHFGDSARGSRNRCLCELRGIADRPLSA